MTDNRTWPHTTPTGFTYKKPTTYNELCALHSLVAQAAIEGWDLDETPPEPTWEMLIFAHREIERLTSQLNHRVY